MFTLDSRREMPRRMFLYRVFDYGDDPQVNEIHGGAIIWQLVCSGILLLNVNAVGPH